MKKLLLLAIILICLTSCSENYSNGERIGMVTQFSNTGILWKSHEGHLNVTQTGMNSSVPFDFSIDNDNEPTDIIKVIDSAAQNGWKVKLIYHETKGWNILHNRGNTNHFVTKCEILDRNPMQTNFGGSQNKNVSGKVIDTIYVVIRKD